MSRPSVIFVCTGNSCRSQMAEGLLRHLAGDSLEVHSAGSHPAGYVHPLAVGAMAEVGIDISRQQSKGLDAFAGREFDYVVTVCGHAQASCPNLRGRRATFHWPLDDPVTLADDEAGARLAARRVREELREKLVTLLVELGLESDAE